MTQTPLRLGWRTCLAWIAVCAVEPICRIVAWTAAQKIVRPEDAHAAAWNVVLPWLVAGGALAPLVLYTWALRRVAPRSPRWIAPPALLAAGLTLAILMGAGLDWHSPRPPAGRLLQAAGLSGLFLLLPTWLVARAGSVRWIVPLAAVMTAAGAAQAAEQLWQLHGIGNWKGLHELALNGWSWGERASAVCLQAGRGALWGAVSAMVFLWLAPRAPRPAQLAAVVPAGQQLRLAVLCALVLAATPFAGLLLQPSGAASASLWLRRAFSSAPAQDISQGDELLRLSVQGDYALRTMPWVASFSPDGGTLLAVDARHRVVRIDTASGRKLAVPGEALQALERPAWAWSPDGRWLALRTDGEVARFAYERHQPRVRLYAVPGYTLTGEYRHRGRHCLADSPQGPVFEADSASLWLACAPYYSEVKPDDLMVLRLGVAPLRMLEERSYGHLAPLQMREMVRIGDSVWAWHVSAGLRGPIRVRDLSRDAEAVRLAPDDAAHPAAAMLLQEVRLTQATVAIRYAVGPLRAMLTYVHDSRSGALLETLDEPGAGQRGPVLETVQGMRIESRWQPDSRAGELLVTDRSGRRQHIRTVAQNLLAVSPDGRWLATQTIGGDRLRLYRISP